MQNAVLNVSYHSYDSMLKSIVIFIQTKKLKEKNSYTRTDSKEH